MRKLFLLFVFMCMFQPFLKGMNNNYALCSYSSYPVANLSAIPLYGWDHLNNKKYPSSHMICYEYVQPKEVKNNDLVEKKELQHDDMYDEEKSDFQESHNNNEIITIDTKIKLPSRKILAQRIKDELGFNENSRILRLYSDSEISIKDLVRVVLLETYIVTYNYKDKIKTVAQFGETFFKKVLCKGISNVDLVYEKYFKKYHTDSNERIFRRLDRKTIKIPNKETIARRIEKMGFDPDEHFLDEFADTYISTDCMLKIIFFDFLDLKFKGESIFTFPNNFIKKLRDEFFVKVLCKSFKNIDQKMTKAVGTEMMSMTYNLVLRTMVMVYNRELEHFERLRELDSKQQNY